MSSLMMKLMKSGDIQLSMDISHEMGIVKSFAENSSYDELFRMSPYPLFLSIKELILHPKSSRRATNHRKHPYKSTTPKRQNRFVIFRRNFVAKLEKEEKKLSIGEISRLAGKEWRNRPDVHWFFEILGTLAKGEHNQEYSCYESAPKEGKESFDQNSQEIFELSRYFDFSSFDP
ncbi:10385_t:CDS:1 [Cetraspora pellucida]|uniref:10385_t:CDS:1 n=1 Tax=Cetraspora pellucida TaxID=1433469 RepID=A0ACA9MNC1_9GLOM|nr:10385_t:CDS:1 [Cetraspora pellucida]